MKSYTFTRTSSGLRIARLASLFAIVLGSCSFALCGPIHDAARKGDLKKVQALIASDPKLVADVDKNGNSPLHVAVMYDNAKVAEFLLANGANVNAKNGYTAFVPDDRGSAFGKHFQNQTDPCFLLTVRGNDAMTGSNGYTPLDLALCTLNHKDTLPLLMAHGADVNARAASGATPLFWAVMKNLKDDVQTLIAKGADVNSKDSYDNSLLHCAVGMDYPAIVEILLAHGAEVNPKDQVGRTPYSYAIGGDDNKLTQLLKSHGGHE